MNKSSDKIQINENALKKMDSNLSQYLFDQRENSMVHATLSEEMSDFGPVVDGDIKTVQSNLIKHRSRVFPKLSESPVLQRKYLFVSSITSCCRFCIEAGMPSDESYGLSDLYILKMDKCQTVEEVSDVYEEMMLDYTKRMQALKGKSKSLSPKVIACMNYIDNHLHDRITVSELATELEMNSSWLSTVFKKEVGISVSEYIKEKKINAAKYLLTFNEYSCADIAEYLGFANESHFSAVFSRMENKSPKEYRREHFQKHFSRLGK